MKAEVLSANRRETIAWAYINELSATDPAEANMRLIAASPALLEAARYSLEKLLFQCPENHMAPVQKDIVKKLRAAIAKATGE